jgi:pimeloyl-ACP methyl ester carboxylesterase
MGVASEPFATELGLRMVCLERPGFGWSDFVANRTVLDWAADVADATSALGIDRYAVAGVSAGAPYALACAARPPPGLDAVGVIAGLVPARFSGDGMFARMIERNRPEAEAAARAHFEAMAGDIDGLVRAMGTGDGPDAHIYARPDVQDRFAATRREAFRQGVEGAAFDLMLAHQPWGFELGDLEIATRWWHGSLDPIVPLADVRAATAGTRIDVTIYEGEGHAIGFVHGADILAALVAPSDP